LRLEFISRDHSDENTSEIGIRFHQWRLKAEALVADGYKDFCSHEGSAVASPSHQDCSLVAFWSCFLSQILLQCKKSSPSAKKIETG